MPEHTPGPWKQTYCGEYKDRGTRQSIVNEALGIVIAEHIPCHANARLIGKAPEMFDTLQSLISALHGRGYVVTACNAAQTLIAEIEGKEADNG